MSAITQFFPSGGGGGGNETPTGVKIPQSGVPVEILGVSGAGGGGGCYGGEGGAGAVFHTTNYFVQPECTVPITIGAGGAAGGCPCGQGTQGGTTSFNYDLKPISVIGGGGGAQGLFPLRPTSVDACPGGNGGGGARYCPNCTSVYTSGCGEGLYFKSRNCSTCAVAVQSTPACLAIALSTDVTERAEAEKFPWGIKAGFPGSSSCQCQLANGTTTQNLCGSGGYSGGNSYLIYSFREPFLGCLGCNTCAYLCCTAVARKCYRTSITGELTNINGSGTFGATGGCGAGTAGGMIVQWATGFGAAPPTGFPGATDISPTTPGYYTYCFTSSGSITIP